MIVNKIKYIMYIRDIGYLIVLSPPSYSPCKATFVNNGLIQHSCW